MRDYLPSLYFSCPLGAEMYIHPSSALHPMQYKLATTCLPVLKVSRKLGLANHKIVVTYISILSSLFPNFVLIVEFIRLKFSVNNRSESMSQLTKLSQTAH
jgi:hypothetical protein